jgi:phosphoglycerol transferase
MTSTIEQQPETVIIRETRRPNHWSIDGSRLALGLGMIGAFLFLVYRDLGLYPGVMADESTYSLYSRLAPFSSATLPSYLYFWVFRQTNHAGSGFLDCARIFNSIFFVGAAPFIYMVARRVVRPSLATFVVLLAILEPTNTYASYFMPESMYYFAFWILTWFLLSFRNWSAVRYGIITGLILGCLALVKVHAVFIAPAAAIFVIAANWHSRKHGWAARSAITLIWITVAAVSSRLVLGYLFAGPAGLHVMGKMYGTLADSSLHVNTLLGLTRKVVFVVEGHLMALALLFAVPVASLFIWEGRPYGATSEDNELFLIKAYTLPMLLVLLAVTVYFTAFISGTGVYESLGRMHMRYYSFALPLLFIVAGGELSRSRKKLSVYVSVPLAVVVAGLALASLWMLRTRYAPNIVDSPEIRGFILNRVAQYAIGGLGIACLALWAFNRRRGAHLFVFVFLPLSVLVSADFANRELRPRLHPDVYERGGAFAHQALSRRQRSRLAIVGSDLVSLFQAKFQVDTPGPELVVIPEGAALDQAKIPASDEWILLIGDHPLPRGTEVQFPMNGFALFSRSNSHAIKFSEQSWFGTINKISGLSGPEEIGRWSDGKEVEIDMASPLPRHFQLKLLANAFGPNVGLPFSIRVGATTQTVRLAATPTEVSAEFATDGEENRIIIDVPQPTSPKEIGFNADTRKIGILLNEMTITPIVEPAQPAPRSKPAKRAMKTHAAQ